MYSLRVYRTTDKSICAILDRPERRLLTGPEFALYENVSRLALGVTEQNLREEDTSESGAKAQQGVEPNAGGVALPDVPPAPMLRIDVPPLGNGDEKDGDNPNGSCALGAQSETGQNSGAECKNEVCKCTLVSCCTQESRTPQRPPTATSAGETARAVLTRPARAHFAQALVERLHALARA
jgi:hypothetical protein